MSEIVNGHIGWAAAKNLADRNTHAESGGREGGRLANTRALYSNTKQNFIYLFFDFGMSCGYPSNGYDLQL